MKQQTKSFAFAGFLTLAILGLCILPQPAYAASFWDSFIPKIITGSMDIYVIPSAILLMIYQAITGILPIVFGFLLQTIMAISGSIPLTPASPGAEGTVVMVGWQFTRDLANMFFVLILAWVGFATILRLKEYEIKTIVPKLILIALLINFIPVICGVIIDVADIITWYFSQKSLNVPVLLWQKLPGVEIVKGGTADLLGELMKLAPGTGGISGIAVKSLMGIVFNLVAAFMLALYAVLFILRVVAIWVLIILAPLAWLGYIIPQGKKIWDMWWKNFIQWTIIGIPLMFFLYLSSFVFGGTSFSQCSVDLDNVANQYGIAQAIIASIFGQTIFCSILPFTAGIIILLVGFILSITLAPSGADTVIKGAERGGKAAAKVLGTRAWQGTTGMMKKRWKDYKLNYQTGRNLGLTRREAFATTSRRALGDYGRDIWGRSRRLPAAVGGGVARTPSLTERIVNRGTWSAIKDSASAGWKAMIKAKKGKKGQRCPVCHQPLTSDSDFCTNPNCATKL